VRSVVRQPLSSFVLETPVPTKLKLPTLSYKGDSDPTDHTEAFESYMSVWEQPDEVWCRVFPTTLHGLAQSWYKGLPDGSVYCYADLRDNFLAQYSCNKRRAVETADLLTMKQGGDESLRSYIKRFDAKVQQVRDLNGQLAAFALMKGLPPGELKDDLIKKERLTLDLARQMADQAIKVEDYHKTWVGHHEGRRSDVRSRLGPDNYEQGRRDKSRSRSERNNKRQHSAYHQTGMPVIPPGRVTIRSLCHEQGRRTEVGEAPKPRGDGDTSQYCEYHGRTGHKTDDCRHLKNAIEEQVRKGDLSKFVSETPETSADGSNKKSAFKRLGVIHVIIGGNENGGSAHGHKRHLNELYQAVNYVPNTAATASTVPDITIGKKDYEGVVAPHSDPLVVHLDIANHLVMRCLIDTGAYTNIMYKECFLGLGLKVKDLSSCTNPLYSFSGAALVPMGSIKLPVQFGQGAAAKNVLAEFVVIDGTSAYNCLIGRVTQSEADAVISIRALTLKYVSDRGEAQNSSRGTRRTR